MLTPIIFEATNDDDRENFQRRFVVISAVAANPASVLSYWQIPAFGDSLKGTGRFVIRKVATQVSGRKWEVLVEYREAV
jgi:hypothetical protein